MTHPGRYKGILCAFFSLDWAGLLVGLLVAGFGMVTFQTGDHWGTIAFGGLIAVTGCILSAGALYHLFKRLPPPGQMISVGSFEMHILAEGEAGDGVPIIWVAGGHGQGLLMHHLHRRMKEETRSILFDRAGSGWSQAGPFPRTIPREADELFRLLQSAGEKGRFLMVGHSFGGLFSANFAHMHPELVSGVLLLDATPPWNLTYAGNMSFGPIRSAARKAALACLFGLGWRRRAMDPGAMELGVTKEFAGMEDQIRLEHARPRTHLSSSSALWTAAQSPFDLVVGEGALGDIPLREIIAPESHDALREQLASELRFSERQIGNLFDGLALSPQEYVRLSAQGELAHAPEGTGHMFPYEDPDFVIKHVHEMMSWIRSGVRGGAGGGQLEI